MKKTFFLLLIVLCFGVKMPNVQAETGRDSVSHGNLIYEGRRGSAGLYAADIHLLEEKISTIPERCFDPVCYARPLIYEAANEVSYSDRYASNTTLYGQGCEEPEETDTSWTEDASGEPDELGTEDAPEESETPDKPETGDPPEDPDEPGSEDVPVTPDEPGSEEPPGTGDAPETPNPPVTPDEPGNEDVPVTPDEPGNEDVPVTPDEPGSEEPPGTGDAPETSNPHATPDKPGRGVALEEDTTRVN